MHTAPISIEAKTAEFIQRRFHVSAAYAHNLAIAVLDGIDSHGCDKDDWVTIEKSVKVVVSSWIKNGSHKSDDFK